MRATVFLVFLVLVLTFGTGVSHADKAQVRIEAPDKAAKGAEITVKVQVSHHGNNLFHHTEWLKVEVNGQPVQKWEFSAMKRPESEDFTRSFTYKVEAPLAIVAEASCNIHGSKGPERWSVVILEESRSEP